MKIKDEILPFIQNMTQKMVAQGNPLKIILFGSRSRGDYGTESDYDFLIIENSTEKRYKRSAKYRRAIKKYSGSERYPGMDSRRSGGMAEGTQFIGAGCIE